MSDSFYVDPWAGSSGSSIDSLLSVGPQTDGTYLLPISAQLTNNPANTAGYSSSTPSWVGDVLTKGIGTLGQYFQNGQMLDYRRYEATNGGLYRQGSPALVSRNGQAQMNPTLLIALIVGGVFLLTRK